GKSSAGAGTLYAVGTQPAFRLQLHPGGHASANAEESLRKLEQLGLEVSIEDSERKKR
ncbi:hypothetical protein LEA_18340, partial [human gut metagenome]